MTISSLFMDFSSVVMGSWNASLLRWKLKLSGVPKAVKHICKRLQIERTLSLRAAREDKGSMNTVASINVPLGRLAEVAFLRLLQTKGGKQTTQKRQANPRALTLIA